jgi:hypothetical protein
MKKTISHADGQEDISELKKSLAYYQELQDTAKRNPQFGKEYLKLRSLITEFIAIPTKSWENDQCLNAVSEVLSFLKKLTQKEYKLFLFIDSEIDNLINVYFKNFERLGPPPRKLYFVKTGLHLEMQKFSSQRDKLKATSSVIENEESEVDGLDFGIGECKALFAIQKLLDLTNYRGNLKGTFLDGENEFKFVGTLPKINIKFVDYYDAYGVGKRMTKRGILEYNANERAEAYKNLLSLCESTYRIRYEQKWIEGKKNQANTISVNMHLFTIIERSKKDVIIEPTPAVVAQIDNYFAQKPQGFYKEIEEVAPRCGKFATRFIEYLFALGEQKRRLGWPDCTIQIGQETLAKNLRMDAIIKSRNKRRLEDTLARCYEIGLKTGWLINCRIEQGKNEKKAILVLNKAKFKQAP